jgi:hypothetical protein
MAIRALINLANKVIKGVSSIISGVFCQETSSIAKFVYGGIVVAAGALTSKILSSAQKGMASSPNYQNVKYTQTNPDLPLPLLYGTVKLAGNLIWQNTTDYYTQKIVAFSEGEISDFSDIRINDIPVEELSNCSVQKFYGSDNQEVTSIVSGNSQLEKIEQVGSLKNVAYLAITAYYSSNVSSDYNVTAIVKGRKIRVYYSESKYSYEYSENPAWVLFDFLTAYNGLGLALNDNSILDDNLISQIFDIQSFLEAASYCDEIVADKPRFSFNMIFDSQTSVRTLLDEIYRSCRGGLFFKNGLLQFKIDKPEPVSKVFLAEHISNEVFKSVPNEEHYDIIKAVYISPEHEWQKVEAFAEIEDRRNGVPVETSVDIYSCTNFQQASRLAWYYLNSKSLQPYYGSFSTDYRAYDLEVGDVIKFDSTLMGLSGYEVKVTQVTDDGAGTFKVDWQTYDENLYSDSLGSLEPHLIVSKLQDLYSYPQNVQNFNVVQSYDCFNFSWSHNENLTCEIREGASWDSAKLIAKNISSNSFSKKIPAYGNYCFRIKFFNGYNYSKEDTFDVISVDYIPQKNIILQQNILTDNGVLSDLIIHNNCLKLANSPNLWQKFDSKWNDLELADFTFANKWGYPVSEGYFISEIFDLGKQFQCSLSLSYDSFGYSEILIRGADDKSALLNTDFKSFIDGDYNFRFYQLKIILKSYTGQFSYLENIIMNVDLPDKIHNFSIEITDSENGYLLDYSDLNYYSTPGIVATVTNSISSFAVTADKTPSSAKIYAVTNSGSKTTAKVDLQLFGY